MNSKVNIFLVFLCFSLNVFSQSTFRLEKTKTFFPDWKELEDENIDWYYLIVPENYNKPKAKKIKLAVSVLRSSNATSNSSIIFLQGGPGGSAITSLWRWLDHPLRKVVDIILIDIRGTGFSEPQMCPDLGQSFLKILSENQTSEEDEKEKVAVSMKCQENLIDNGIDINSYNSISVSKDLNALRKSIEISQWHVYGVSYGTFLSQEYAYHFPDDVKSLILDSSISDISDYYDRNTSNYLGSLNKLFDACRNNTECNEEFPNLKEIYFSVIRDLQESPLTVDVDSNMIPSGVFTYNAEDFKIAIHQSLYQREMIEVLPLLIYQFHERKKNSLGILVGAFSGALSLDYGTYYCFTCSEAISNNNINDYYDDASKSTKLKGGLSFYKSDFDVCQDWNKKANTNSDVGRYSQNNEFPVLVFSGGLDPITPISLANETVKNYRNARLILANTFGHVPSLSEAGNEIVTDFVSEEKIIKPEEYSSENIKFVPKVYINKGIYNFGTDINNFDWLFFTPLFVGIFILISFLFYFFLELKNTEQKVLNYSSLVSTFLGLAGIGLLIFSVYDSSETNFYILVFGLLNKYSFIFIFLKLFAFSSLVSILCYLLLFFKVKNRQYYIIFTFSLLVVNAYLFYWGILL